MKELGKFSIGTGDLFGMQGKAQLSAIKKASEEGVFLIPVWNKSFVEHQTMYTDPEEVRIEADQAVKALNWNTDYFVDADLINHRNIDPFIKHSDYFTIDVTGYTDQKKQPENAESFIDQNLRILSDLCFPWPEGSDILTHERIKNVSLKYLYPVQQAARLYRKLENIKGKGNFITEIALNASDTPQTPLEMFLILSALASEKVPVQAISPRFSGYFSPGIDFKGDLNLFTREFETHIIIIDLAIKEFNLPKNLKLSLHSGNDKFSLYPVIKKTLNKHKQGIHLKTSGSSWLDEVTGLSLAGGEALDLVKSMYRKAYIRRNELYTPYKKNISIDESLLPNPDEVDHWDEKMMVDSLNYTLGNSLFNPDLRQLFQIGYKIAAEYCNIYISMIRGNEKIISEQVNASLYENHIKQLFFEDKKQSKRTGKGQ